LLKTRQVKIKNLRTDNGKQYVNKAFQDYLKMKGITYQTTVPYTMKKYGVAERVNRTVVGKARSTLQD